jgi:hypothetical protein
MIIGKRKEKKGKEWTEVIVVVSAGLLQLPLLR